MMLKRLHLSLKDRTNLFDASGSSPELDMLQGGFGEQNTRLIQTERKHRIRVWYVLMKLSSRREYVARIDVEQNQWVEL